MTSLRLGWVSLILVPLLQTCGTQAEFREITFEDLRDKLKGGWAGQMIGVSYGAPTEFRYLGRIIPEEEIPEWRPDRIHNSIRQDDLYVEMTFAQVLDEKGLEATTQDFGDMFRNAKYRLWHANLAARRALKRGVPAEKAGTPEYNAHANDIDFQIEADFIGLMSPGLPVASNDLCWRVGRVMNSGDGIYGGVFVAGMYAAAFFESDVREVVKAGLACLPPESPYAKVILDVLKWSSENPGDWTKTWQLLEDKWDVRDPCPAGALLPFNIDAKLNGAYIALGLLYGQGDFWKTLDVSTRAGQDSDCNPSNAAGVLGVMLGYEQIPDRLKKGIEEIADEKFSFTNYSFNSIIDSNQKWIVQMVENHGGRVEGEKLLIKTQAPEPAVLEVWDDYGSPAERVGVDDPKWQWTEEGPEYASPSLLTVEGTKQIVTLTEKSIVGIGVADGKLLWQLPFLPERRAYNAATPIIDGETVIYTGAGRGTKAVKIEKQTDGFAAKEIWSNAEVAPQYWREMVGMVFEGDP